MQWHPENLKKAAILYASVVLQNHMLKSINRNLKGSTPPIGSGGTELHSQFLQLMEEYV